MARQCLHANGAGEGLERAAGSPNWGRLEALSSGEGEGWGRASFVVPAEPPKKRWAGAAETLFTARGLIVCQGKWLPESSSLKRKKRPDEDHRAASISANRRGLLGERKRTTAKTSGWMWRSNCRSIPSS